MFSMLNQYVTAPHFQNVLHLIAKLNKAQLLAECLSENYPHIKSILHRNAPLHYANVAGANVLLGFHAHQAKEAVH
jgi:hypothetical protein